MPLEMPYYELPGHTCHMIGSVLADWEECESDLTAAVEEIKGVIQRATDNIGRYCELESIREANSNLRAAAEGYEEFAEECQNHIKTLEDTIEELRDELASAREEIVELKEKMENSLFHNQEAER